MVTANGQRLASLVVLGGLILAVVPIVVSWPGTSAPAPISEAEADTALVVLPANGFDDFGRAIRQKFVVEISRIERRTPFG